MNRSWENCSRHGAYMGPGPCPDCSSLTGPGMGAPPRGSGCLFAVPAAILRVALVLVRRGR